MEFIQRIINAITQLHPLHPMIVHFPIALSGAGFLFILMAAWKKNEAFEKAAFYNAFLAAIATLFASGSGMYSNLTNYDGVAPNAVLKVVLGTILLIILVVLVINRWRNPQIFQTPKKRGLYIAAYGSAFVLNLVLGFLGGVILYGF